MRICVSRPANGITLNAGIREYLCDEKGKIMPFENEVLASAFLVEMGFNADDFTDILFHQICVNCGEPVETHGDCIGVKSLKP